MNKKLSKMIMEETRIPNKYLQWPWSENSNLQQGKK